jgi:hypothetical protein
MFYRRGAELAQRNAEKEINRDNRMNKDKKDILFLSLLILLSLLIPLKFSASRR